MTSSWETPPEQLDITHGEVHVWGVSLLPTENLLKNFENSLSSDERTRAERFKFSHLRRRFIASQGHLRHILGRYLHQPPHSLEFQRTERGKPFLDIPQARNFRFNVSHSHELAVYGIMPAQMDRADHNDQRESSRGPPGPQVSAAGGQIEDALQEIAGLHDLRMDRVLGAPHTQYEMKFEKTNPISAASAEP